MPNKTARSRMALCSLLQAELLGKENNPFLVLRVSRVQNLHSALHPAHERAGRAGWAPCRLVEPAGRWQEEFQGPQPLQKVNEIKKGAGKSSKMQNAPRRKRGTPVAPDRLSLNSWCCFPRMPGDRNPRHPHPPLFLPRGTELGSWHGCSRAESLVAQQPRVCRESLIHHLQLYDSYK